MPTPSAELFLELIKEKREKQSPRVREKTQAKKINEQWLFPVAIEGELLQKFRGIFKPFNVLIFDTMRTELSTWLDTYRQETSADGVDIRRDQAGDDIARLGQELRSIDPENFAEEAEADKTPLFIFLAGLGFKVSRQNQGQFNKFARAVTGFDFPIAGNWEAETIRTWALSNFELIKGLKDEYIKRISFELSNGIMINDDEATIKRKIRKVLRELTASRTKLIARDQVGTLNGLLTKRRMEEAGITYYLWQTRQDERVRHTHRNINQKICDWKNNNRFSFDPGVVRKLKWLNRVDMPIAIPGQEINCRCVAVPWFRPLNEEADKRIEENIVNVNFF